MLSGLFPNIVRGRELLVLDSIKYYFDKRESRRES